MEDSGRKEAGEETRASNEIPAMEADDGLTDERVGPWFDDFGDEDIGSGWACGGRWYYEW